MSTKLNYLFIDPNPRAQSTYAAILAVCMECGREKAEKAIRAAAADQKIGKAELMIEKQRRNW